MKSKLLAIAASALLTLSAVAHASQPEAQADNAPAAAPTSTANPFDPGYWLTPMGDAAQQPPISGELNFNAAHPGSWMQWIDPRTHIPTHMTFMNPASYAQFMRPQFYLQFTQPENLMAWMNPASYRVMMDPKTVNYWMNPNSYLHVADPALYQEAINPANYMIYLNPATYAGLTGSLTCDQNATDKSRNWFGFAC